MHVSSSAVVQDPCQEDRRLNSEHLLSTAYRSRSLNNPYTRHNTSYSLFATLNTPQICGFSIGKSSLVCDYEDVITDLATGVSSDNLPPSFDAPIPFARLFLFET